MPEKATRPTGRSGDGPASAAAEFGSLTGRPAIAARPEIRTDAGDEVARGGGAYSVAIRWLKIALPLGALAVVGVVFFAVSRGGIDPRNFPVVVDGVSFEGGMRLNNPRFTGATSRGEPFLLRADWARPDAPDPTSIELSNIVGEIDLGDGDSAELTARSGVLLPKEDKIRLDGDVIMLSSDGHAVRAFALNGDAETMTLESEGPVRASGPSGDLLAGRATLVEGEDGALFAAFDGGVCVTLRKLVKSRANEPGEAVGPFEPAAEPSEICDRLRREAPTALDQDRADEAD